MSLTYDPTAIRYASIQTAYGCTWTLDKIEDDGAQVWKNVKGQEAIVPRVVTAKLKWETSKTLTHAEEFTTPAVANTSTTVYDEVSLKPLPNGELEVLNYEKNKKIESSCPQTPVWKLMDIGQGNDAFARVARNPIKSDNLGHFQPDPPYTGHITEGYAYDRALTPEEVTKVYTEGPDAVPGAKRLFGNANSGRTSSTKPNESNTSKNRQGVNEKFAGDGKRMLRWDGQKWRNTSKAALGVGNTISLSGEVQVAGDSLGVREEPKALKADTYDDRIKDTIKSKIASHYLGSVTISDTEIFNLLTKVYK